MRIAVMACLGIAGTMSTLNGPRAAIADSLGAHGNSSVAHTCQGVGYATVIGTDGLRDTQFGNTGECVRYGSHSGTLVPLADAQPCLNGGFQTLGPSAGAPAFAGEAACVLHVGTGGSLVPVGDVTLQNVPVSNARAASTITLSASLSVSTDAIGFSFSGIVGSGSGTYSANNDSAIGSGGTFFVSGVQATGFEGDGSLPATCQAATTRLATFAVTVEPTGSSTPIAGTLLVQAAPTNIDGNASYLVQLSVPGATYTFGTYTPTLPTNVQIGFQCAS